MPLIKINKYPKNLFFIIANNHATNTFYPPPPIIKVILIKYKYFIYYFKVSFIFIKFQTFLFLLN